MDCYKIAQKLGQKCRECKHRHFEECNRTKDEECPIYNDTLTNSEEFIKGKHYNWQEYLFCYKSYKNTYRDFILNCHVGLLCDTHLPETGSWIEYVDAL